jgi:hypothetical protein
LGQGTFSLSESTHVLSSASEEKTWKAEKARLRFELEVSLFSCLFSYASRKVSVEQGLKVVVQSYCGCAGFSCCPWLRYCRHNYKGIFNIPVHCRKQIQTFSQFVLLPTSFGFWKSHIRQLKLYTKKGDLDRIHKKII